MSPVFAIDSTPSSVALTNFYVGLGLAIGSSIFIGSSFIIKKKGLLKLSRHGLTRAGMGGYGYLKEWVWWAGFLSMGLGECANFAAYAFAPASLVTPLGVLSVLVSAVLSSYFLGERLNLLGKIGCVLCILGSTVIVLHSPKEGSVDSIEQMGEMMKDAGFIIYVIFVVSVSLVLIFCYAPKYGTSNVLIYVLICSVIGSLSVMACKGLGLALRETFSGTRNEFGNWLTWFSIFSIVACVTVQMNYLNKALDVFNTSVVTPIYYVFFTTFVIIASSVLFKEWRSMNAQDIMGSISGFLTVICAIFLLNAFKDWDVSLSNLHTLFQRVDSSPVTSPEETSDRCTVSHSRSNSGTINRSHLPSSRISDELSHTLTYSSYS